jgi:hypothetical protein
MRLAKRLPTAAFLGLAWAALAVLAAFSLATAGPAAAHLGATAFILVPADHVLPGDRFDVVGSDMGASSAVAFQIVNENTQVTASLESVTAGADGHFQVTLTLPTDFPDGYAVLTATATDGTRTSTWVLVGVRTASTPPSPATRQWWTDPSVIVLGVLVVGGLALVTFALLRRRPPQRLAVRAGSRSGCAPVRRSTKGKRSRR